MSRRPSAMHGTGSRTVLRKRPCGHRQPPPFWQDRRGSTNVLRPLQNDSTPSVRGQHSIRPRTALRPSTDSTPSVHGQLSVCPRTALRLSTDSTPSVHGQLSVRPRTALRPSTDSSPSVHGQHSVTVEMLTRDVLQRSCLAKSRASESGANPAAPLRARAQPRLCKYVAVTVRND